MERARDPFAEDFVSIVDWECGYSINIPVEMQGYPGWWNDEPEIIARILKLRKERGIQINDAASTLEGTVSEGEKP